MKTRRFADGRDMSIHITESMNGRCQCCHDEDDKNRKLDRGHFLGSIWFVRVVGWDVGCV